MAVRDSLEGGLRASVFSSCFDGTGLVYSNSSAVFFCVCVSVKRWWGLGGSSGRDAGWVGVNYAHSFFGVGG